MNFSKAEFVRSAASSRDFPRDSLPRVIFAGRSNVGKSSSINCLLQRKNFARVSAVPGKTVFVNLFLVDKALWLVDLPGYGYARVSQREKQRFSQLIEEYMNADRDNVGRAYLIVDARHDPTADDRLMADWFRVYGVPMAVIANKVDKLKKSQVEPNMERIRQVLELDENTPLFPFSAEKGTGREEVRRDILGLLNR